MTNAENAIANLKNMKYLCETDNHGRGYGIFHVNEGDKAWIDEAIKALSEPTIPLSVIEKIHDAIDNADSDDFYEDEHGYYIIDSMLTKEHIHEIIDKAVKEIEHECSY